MTKQMDKSTRNYSKIQEKFIAKIFDGKVVSNSGATPFFKGDVQIKDNELNILLECKTKTKTQTTHSIKKEWIESIKKESKQSGLDFGWLVFDYGEEKKTIDNQYIVISVKDFIDYREMLKNG